MIRASRQALRDVLIMPINRWSILCAKAVIDKFTGTLSIFDVIESVEVGFPEAEFEKLLAEAEDNAVAFSQRFTVVSLWTRSDVDIPEMGSTKVVFCSPTGKAIAEGPELKVNLVDGRRSRTLANFPSLAFCGNGIYSFRVMYKGEAEEWTMAADVPLEIVTRPIEDERPSSSGSREAPPEPLPPPASGP